MTAKRIPQPSTEEQAQRFKKFLKWFENCEGHERADAQSFCLELLRAFGVENAKGAGVDFEKPLKKKTTGNTGFADMVWDKRVLVEMKERGTDLRKHYQQVADYWFSLTPKTKYVCLCNFDEIWIYDFNIQMEDPVHYFKTANLESDFASLGFLFAIEKEPLFNNNHVEVTERAGKKMGQIYQSLVERKIEASRAQRFILQLVVAMFSEDVGLIPPNTLRQILHDATNLHSNDNEWLTKELKDLFKAMATQENKPRPKKYAHIPYFNGGLFEEYNPAELRFSEINEFYNASEENWAQVRPSIFGSIFEATVDEKKRHAHGIHYTSELDIMKIVNPTIIRPFREKIDEANGNTKKLNKILEELQKFKVLDPACGSGNFLYLAFRALRRLEFEIREELGGSSSLLHSSSVQLKNFYGIDINSFGLELAKIALSIGLKLSADEFGYKEKVLPFENLDDHFLCADALFVDWFETDAIIGNPPFLGMRHFRENLGDEYADKMLEKFADVKGRVDYCVYWFKKAHETRANFIGLVGTNTISQGESRKAGLDYVIQNDGTIVDAISSQVWSGEAVVHVSIVNWRKKPVSTVYLDGKVVDSINSSLKTGKAITDAKTLSKNKGKSFQGCLLLGKDFIITEEQVNAWIKEDPKNKLVLKNYVDGTAFLAPNTKLGWVIDFENRPIETAQSFRAPFEHVKKFIKPVRAKNKDRQRREKWWCYARSNSDLREAISKSDFYFALTQQHKYTMFRPLSSKVLPCEAVMVVASDDFYILGVLNSKFHREWVLAQASTLKGDTRYTNTTCFETFPFLWEASEKQKDSVREVMKNLDNFRMKTMKEKDYGITKLYNEFFNEPTSQLFKFHRELDEAVAKVYGWKLDPTKNYDEELYNLNQKLWEQEQPQMELKAESKVEKKRRGAK